jgi:acyl-CoA synthetase (AMP-forming)/AMP-acid ligase II
MAPSDSNHIYNSADVAPLIPGNESLWQFYLRCNPDFVKDDKVIMEESNNPKATLTYGGARQKAAQGAAGLQKVLGVKEGDVIALWGSNSINWILAVYAATWAGITASLVESSVATWRRSCMADAHSLALSIRSLQPTNSCII